tara:strand:+ start:484 stop:1242 length:759 start_codon:yes stop_codon:yes gene_type:complete
MRKKIYDSIKKLILFTTLVSVVSVGSFIYGTFNPNKMIKADIQRTVETKHALWAKDLGLHEPEMIYRNNIEFIHALNKCVDFLNFQTPPELRVPYSMLSAQAVLESGWGTSRFAKEGNNLFGIRTWNKDNGMLPIGMSPDTPWRVRSFDTKCGSVKEYMSLLNYHEAYADFRELRTKMLKNGEPLDGKKLIKTLKAFSTTKDYSTRVINMMNKIDEVTLTEEFDSLDLELELNSEMEVIVKEKPPIPLKKPN